MRVVALVALGMLSPGCKRKGPSLVMPSVTRDTIVPGCWRVGAGNGDLATGSTLCFLERTYVVTTPTGRTESRAVRWQESSPTQWDGVVEEGTPEGRWRVVSDQHGAATLESIGITVPLTRVGGFDPEAALRDARAVPTPEVMCQRALRCAEGADLVLGARTFADDVHPNGSLALCRNEINGIREVLARMSRPLPDTCRE